MAGIRGLYSTALDRLFVVWKDELFEINSDGDKISRGFLESKTGVVNFSENEFQMILVDGIYGYLYTFATNALTVIKADGFVSGTHIINLDGFFVIPRLGTGEFANSDFQDGSDASWNAGWYYNAESIPDPIQAIAKLNGQMWIFGSKSAEVWYTSGTSDDPSDIFSRNNQGLFDIGTSARYSVATNSNSIFWLGSNAQGAGIVWMASGFQPQRISTHAIENIIGDLIETDDARGFCYQQEGHFFYCLNFIRGNKTLVYDVTTGLWHERAAWDTDSGEFNYWNVIATAYSQGRVVAGSARDGKIFELSLDYYSDNGNEIRRERTGSHIHQDRRRMFFKRFEIDSQRGVGLTNGQGKDPVAMLQMSDDGGETWSNERYSSPGKKGKYRTSMDWNRLGSSRDRVFKLVVSDPVKWIITGATVEVEAGE